MFRYPKTRHPKLTCCQRHMIIDATQLDIHHFMDDNIGDDANHAYLAFLWDNFDSCLAQARLDVIYPSETFFESYHFVDSAEKLYYAAEDAELGTKGSLLFLKRWVLRYTELLQLAQCFSCDQTHILCCDLRRNVQPPSLEHYLYLKHQPEHYAAHIYLPIPNQSWAMYVRDHISDNMDKLEEPTLPERGFLIRSMFGDVNQKHFRNDDYVKQMHSLLAPGYRATPIKVRLAVRHYMAAWLNDDHPLSLQLTTDYIRDELKQLYWDNFSLEFSIEDDNCAERKIMYQIRNNIRQNELIVVLPGTGDNLFFSHIAQYMEFPALSKLSQQLGGKYCKTNLGILGAGIAKATLRLLSDPYLLQATNNSCDLFTGRHHFLDCRFPQLLMGEHANLIKKQSGLVDYSWHISEYLVHGLYSFDHLDNPVSRGRTIWDRYSWDYVPLLKAATVLCQYPCLLLWYCLDRSPAHSLTQSTNNGHLSSAIQGMDNALFEMKLAGVSSTYFLQMYLAYLGKYALEIFVAIHIKPVYNLWWKNVGVLNVNAQNHPSVCSCPPGGEEEEEDDDSGVEYSNMVNDNELLEMTE